MGWYLRSQVVRSVFDRSPGIGAAGIKAWPALYPCFCGWNNFAGDWHKWWCPASFIHVVNIFNTLQSIQLYTSSKKISIRYTPSNNTETDRKKKKRTWLVTCINCKPSVWFKVFCSFVANCASCNWPKTSLHLQYTEPSACHIFERDSIRFQSALAARTSFVNHGSVAPSPQDLLSNLRQPEFDRVRLGATKERTKSNEVIRKRSAKCRECICTWSLVGMRINLCFQTQTLKLGRCKQLLLSAELRRQLRILPDENFYLRDGLIRNARTVQPQPSK